MISEKQRKNSSDFYQRHKDEILIKHVCNVCGGSYSISNKTNHERSQKHQFVKKLLDSQKNLENQENLII